MNHNSKGSYGPLDALAFHFAMKEKYDPHILWRKEWNVKLERYFPFTNQQICTFKRIWKSALQIEDKQKYWNVLTVQDGEKKKLGRAAIMTVSEKAAYVITVFLRVNLINSVSD